jgi:hypothetical protein
VTTNGVGQDGESIAVYLDKMPQPALQAIYHAVTGKTERLSDELRRNVVVNFSDIECLHQQICAQISHYALIAAPTVTIVMNYGGGKKEQYSSWERFKFLQTSTTQVTSDISLKYEFLISLPNTPGPQRCVIGIMVDSAALIMAESESSFPFSFFDVSTNFFF